MPSMIWLKPRKKREQHSRPATWFRARRMCRTLAPCQGPARAFTMKQGEISGPLNLGASQAVLQIVERQEPSTSDPEFAKQRDQLRERLAGQKRQEVLGLFVSDLNTRMEKEGKVKINKTEMDNLAKSRS